MAGNLGSWLPRRWGRNLKSAMGAQQGARELLAVYRPDYNTIYSNFLGDALPGEWTAAKTNGTSAAVSVATSQLTLTSGTDDNGYAGQGYGLFWKGDLGMFFEQQGSLSSLTTQKLEIGISDATDDAGAVNTKATPTGTADDFCVLVFDTDDNTEFDLISEIDDGGPTANAEDVHTLVAGTDFTTEFKYQNDVVAVYLNGQSVGSGSCQGGDLVTPWIFTQSRDSSSSGIWTSEYWIVTGPSGVTVL